MSLAAAGMNNQSRGEAFVSVYQHDISKTGAARITYSKRQKFSEV